MDWLSRIFAWLSDHEAGISAVAAIIVIAGVVFAGLRWLLRRRAETATEKGTEEDPLLALPTGPVIALLEGPQWKHAGLHVATGSAGVVEHDPTYIPALRGRAVH